MEDCLFCKIIKGEVQSKIIYEDDQLVAIEDINPQAPVHILLIPKKHIKTSVDLNDEDKDLVGCIFLAANKIARERGIADSGFRVIVNCNRDSGQVVFHIHFHLIGGRQMGWPPG